MELASISDRSKLYALIGLPLAVAHRYIKLQYLVSVYSLSCLIASTTQVYHPAQATWLNAVLCSCTILNQSCQQVNNTEIADKFGLIRTSFVYYAQTMATYMGFFYRQRFVQQG